jgi:hypothetical protein
MSGFPKQLGSANPMSSMNMTTIFGLSLSCESAKADARLTERQSNARKVEAFRFIGTLLL